MTKSVRWLLFVLFILLQYKLWFADGNVSHVWHLQKALQMQKSQNANAKQRNTILSARIKSLKQGGQAVEERARSDLGMVKDDEVYYRIIEKK